MSASIYTYIIELQYLGFRYSGWQVQKDVKTIQYMLDRTLKFIYEDKIKIKSLGSSRTDRMVSAMSFHCEIFCDQILDIDDLFLNLEKNLPADIRVIKAFPIDKNFQIIHPSHQKEYIYCFSYGKKAHPYSAPFIYNSLEKLDIDLMKIACKLFEGKHFFKKYCYRPEGKDHFFREISHSEIIPNDILTANFFPKNSYVFKVKGNGFLHHQVRIMMGTLIDLGLGKLNIEDIEDSLKETEEEVLKHIGFIAPSSGLHLYKSLINLEGFQQS